MHKKRFHPGQKITPNKRSLWDIGPDMPVPMFGEVYTVHRYDEYLHSRGYWLIDIAELRPDIGSYRETAFDPVVEDAVLAEDLASIRIPEADPRPYHQVLQKFS